MGTCTNVVRLRQPAEIDDPLTDLLRTGAHRFLAQAVEMKAEAFLAAMQDLRLPDGRARLVRHGHGPERAIQTGIGPLPVARARVRVGLTRFGGSSALCVESERRSAAELIQVWDDSHLSPS